MISILAALALAASPQLAAADTAPSPPPPSILTVPLAVADSAPADRLRPRRVIIEYSDWYGRRLTAHRWASYTMLPLFAVQYAAGQQLLDKGSDAPSWARNSHGAMATGTAALFTANTVTGLWNLWDARKDPAGRGPRIAHSLLMLASDAGFTAAGLLAEQAQNSGSRRQMHKTIALGSMGAALIGYAMMLPPFRRD